MTEKVTFGDLVGDALYRKDRTNTWLAKQVGVTGTTIGRWISGGSRPSQKNVIDVARALGLSRAELLEAAEYVYREPIQPSEPSVSSASSGSTDTVIVSGAPPFPSLLVGRDDDLEALRQRLTAGESTTLLTAVRGWPGVGKTTLAAALAHDRTLHQAFPDGVLWTALGEEPTLLLALGEWMMALGDDPQRYPTIEGRSKRLGAMLHARQMLLVVDDVWKAEHAVPFMVGGSDCRTLITNRQPEVAQGLGLTNQAIYLLGVLSDAEALELLRQLAPQATGLDPSGTLQLVKELEGLPLALQVAGRLLEAEAAMGWGINDLLGELIEGTKLMEAKAPADRTDLETQTTPTIAVLFEKSTARLDSETRERFALLSIFVSKPATFDAPAVGAAWDVTDPRPTLRTLVSRGLLEPAMDGRFQMHSLLTVHARMLSEES